LGDHRGVFYFCQEKFSVILRLSLTCWAQEMRKKKAAWPTIVRMANDPPLEIVFYRKAFFGLMAVAAVFCGGMDVLCKVF